MTLDKKKRTSSMSKRVFVSHKKQTVDKKNLECPVVINIVSKFCSFKSKEQKNNKIITQKKEVIKKKNSRSLWIVVMRVMDYAKHTLHLNRTMNQH